VTRAGSAHQFPIEIERKYLLRELPSFPRTVGTLEIDQGYLPGVKLVERLRRQRSADGVVRFYRTVKFGDGVERVELEDETDPAVFDHLWQLTEGRRLKKRRHLVPNGDDTWEIDEFLDRQLVLAELELERADAKVDIPGWLKPVLVREVTDEREYTNRSLAR
jgi:adenylate cyclase